MKSVSVVIPNYLLDPLKNNLDKIIEVCPKNTEIIIVDDCSPDHAAEYFQTHYPKIKLIKNQQNLRFAKTANLGVKTASHNLVFLMNSDVVPKKNFLDPLVKHFDNPQTFAASCLETQLVNHRQVYSGLNQCQFKQGLLVHSAKSIKDFSHSTANCWASGGSMLLDRSKFLALGGFDSLYEPAYWEDIDLAWRSRSNHWSIIFEPQSQVIHQHETTNASIFSPKQIAILSHRNQLLFIWKNIRGIDLLKHFIWLPYHLVVTSYKTQGLFFIAFFQALLKWLKK